MVLGIINSLTIQGEPVIYDLQKATDREIIAANACVSIMCANEGNLSNFQDPREAFVVVGDWYKDIMVKKL